MFYNSRLYSVLFNKCPRCHKGDFFIKSSAFNRHFDDMHDQCSNCDLNFNPEPGFYWASMFISYTFYTIWILITFFIVVVWLEVDLNYYLIGLILTLLFLIPYFFRIARRTWLTIFVRPDLRNASPTYGI
ncbi:DUF983 domain-containing protein [Spirosoma areae]